MTAAKHLPSSNWHAGSMLGAVFLFVVALATCGGTTAAESAAEAVSEFRRHCGECHLDGADEGGVVLDGILDPAVLPAAPDAAGHSKWLAVWKNLRAGTMPPTAAAQPSEEERRRLSAWVVRDRLGVDPTRPDPGHVVLRRLNRVEYANTVRDLIGIDIDVIDDLPADDTGYGFDTIGAVLSVSPLLLEKYVDLAHRVADRVAETRGSILHRPGDDLRRSIERLAIRGFRRPADAATVDRLLAIARAAAGDASTIGDGSSEKGLAAVLTAVLASPRFLFRLEEDAAPGPDDPPDAVRIDEYALASRLSYLLWSSMPDDELFSLAAAGRLREELPAQLRRMIQDRRSDAFVANFVGQWLQTRDVQAVPVSLKRIVKVADEKEEKKQQEAFDDLIRPAMRAETEMLFAHLLRTDRPATDLIVGRSTFLNAALAEFYGVEGVEGTQMRLVELPPDSRRGGLLTHGSFLVVTSTPSRTSPVKRGLFILENLLGAPPPPAPPDVPSLEAAAKRKNEKASVRDLLARHRSDAVCASCHDRMDPLGLVLEGYNALGQWRGEERGGANDFAGRLATGEPFRDARDLAETIAEQRRRDFHRCLAEKLLTYALGRGTEYFDEPAIERIVTRLEKDGRLAVLVEEVVGSVPFQMRRRGTDLSPKPEVSL